MKIYNSLIAFTFLLTASCTSEVADVLPDGSSEINVALTKGISTRAVSGYRNWDAQSDPSTMGVIALADNDTYIYNNQSFSAPSEGEAWDITTGTKAKWSTYATASTLDFFGYMPYMSGASVSRNANTWTLTLNNVPGVSAVPYLAVTAPVRYTSAYGNLTPVPLQMDQLMTAFEFQFQLGEAMGNLRTFKITKVKMSEIPATATVAQAYTIDGTWAKGEESISNIASGKTSAEVANAEGIKIGYNHSAEAVAFPSMIYMLPFNLSTVTPKIEVTYDVYDQDGFKTRSTTSEIVLNEKNFGTIGTAVSAHKNVIRIQIVPDVLKVLSDADQSIGGYLEVKD